MTSGVVEPLFIDTNVLVYATEQRAPLHAVAMQRLQAFYASGGELWISRQVIREYLATLTRTQLWGSPQPVHVLTAEVRHFQSRFRMAEDDANATARLLTPMETTVVGGRQVHDANIVATMQAHGIRRLLTHNTGDFARFAGLITVVPLA